MHERWSALTSSGHPTSAIMHHITSKSTSNCFINWISEFGASWFVPISIFIQCSKSHLGKSFLQITAYGFCGVILALQWFPMVHHFFGAPVQTHCHFHSIHWTLRNQSTAWHWTNYSITLSSSCAHTAQNRHEVRTQCASARCYSAEHPH